MRVSRWGNSLAVRLPSSVVKALQLEEGDDIQIHVCGARDIEIERSATNLELLARLRRYRGRLPSDFRFDRLEINDRG